MQENKLDYSLEKTKFLLRAEEDPYNEGRIYCFFVAKT